MGSFHPSMTAAAVIDGWMDAWKWVSYLKKESERSVWTCLRINPIKFSKGPPVIVTGADS